MSQQTTPQFRIPKFTAGDRFRKARELAGFENQSDLAEHIGVSKGTISNYETGATTNLRKIVVNQWALGGIGETRKAEGRGRWRAWLDGIGTP